MTQLFANNASTTLNGAIDDSQLTITLTDSTEFPAPTGAEYFLATLFDVSSGAWEVIRCTDNTANVLTVTRGHEGSAAAFADDDLIQANLTKATLDNLFQNDGTQNLTSLGIDDNATSEVLQLSDSAYTVGQTGANLTIQHKVDTHYLGLQGSSSASTSARIRLYGNGAATNSDAFFDANNQTWMHWDESVGDLEILTGSGAKATHVTFNPDQSTNFVGDVSAGGYIQSNTATSAELDAIADAINTDAGKIQGAMVYNTTVDKPVWAVGNADGDVWVDGSGATINTPV